MEETGGLLQYEKWNQFAVMWEELGNVGYKQVWNYLSVFSSNRNRVSFGTAPLCQKCDPLCGMKKTWKWNPLYLSAIISILHTSLVQIASRKIYLKVKLRANHLIQYSIFYFAPLSLCRRIREVQNWFGPFSPLPKDGGPGLSENNFFTGLCTLVQMAKANQENQPQTKNDAFSNLLSNRADVGAIYLYWLKKKSLEMPIRDVAGSNQSM